MRAPPKPRPNWKTELHPIAVQQVQRVADQALLNPESLFNGTSTNQVRAARAKVMMLLRVAHGWGLQEVADCFLVTHSTVLHAIRKQTGQNFDPPKNTSECETGDPMSRSNLREYAR